MKKLISVVIPMYFEEAVVDECYRRMTTVMEDISYNYELIFVNDGSTDRTMPILSSIAEGDSRVKIIDFARNFGHQVAVTAGVDYASGDAVVIIDADLQDPPELIKDMVSLWENGFDVVYARRRKRLGETFFKLATAKCFYKFLNYMSDIEIPKDTGDYRLMDRRVVEVLKNMPERNRFLRGMVSWLGFRQTYVEFERSERFAGETKYPLKKMLKLAEDGIISFSAKPVKLIFNTGIVFLGVFLGELIYVIAAKLLGKGFDAWAYVLIFMTLIAGIMLLSLGILGKYITRIYDESKNRPLYIVKETKNIRE